MKANETQYSLKIISKKNNIENITTFLDNGTKENVLSVESLDDDIEFYHSLGNGISNCQMSKMDLVSSLLSVDDSIASISAFFSTYGFFINSPDKLTLYDVQPTIDAKNVIICITTLLNELNSENPNYEVLYNTFVKLISFSGIFLTNPQISIYAGANQQHISAPNGLSYLNDCTGLSIDAIKTLHTYPNVDFECTNEPYTKYDFVLDTTVEITDFLDYPTYDKNHNMIHIPFSDYINLLYNYAKNIDSQFTLDVFSFFYHLSNNHRKNINDSKNNFELAELTTADLSINLKNKLIVLCQRICQEYINEGIECINLELDLINKQKNVSIPNLLSAIFYNLYSFDFGNFYYEKCAKPNCNKYFIKAKNNSKSIYCCAAHARSEAQAALRKRIKEGSQNQK